MNVEISTSFLCTFHKKWVFDSEKDTRGRKIILPDKKTERQIGVILLTEYHASFIRLWRVVLLRSDIRLSPSGIRYASLEANKISLKP